ncbi:M24 family metallopeptidase [Novosphingobium pokkalii]|uniref:M24 family metallopeptidase n=1 Tax=Novosphingobium pokkalii TaxID=1770194 RepID=A0ABV7V7B6_9SPHN|nr:M24 family metallopeptidase [Novosphingobium pokkalii]
MNPAVDSVGPAWSLPAMRAAQAQAWTAIERLAAAIHPGLRESEAKAVGEAIMADLGMGQAWHPMVVRFGANTLRVFSDRGGEDLTLAENDIFFIDIGPVLLGHEADVGATFAVGKDPEMHACAAAARDLWHRVAAIWNHGVVRGTALYARAAQEAEAMGWHLNLDVRGHRVADYPHPSRQAGKLADLDSLPTPGLWILEIQIRHPTRPFGAFYEDLLG